MSRFVQVNTDSPKGRKQPIGYETQDNGCWLWVGATAKGYGTLRIGDRMVPAHVWMWELQNGAVPAGMELDHFYCDCRRCVNPSHVRPVTRRENQLRGMGVSAVNASKTHCPRGHELFGDNLAGYERRLGTRKCNVCRNARRRRQAA